MTKLIAEIGINHNGSFSEAKKLIDISNSTNCWGIKFQYRNLKNYFLQSSRSSELGKEIIDKELKKNFLNHSQIKKLSYYARKKNLKVGISLFSKKDYTFFKDFKFDFFKIPSPVSHDYELINFLKNKSNHTIISFGGKNYNEIKKIIFDCKLVGKKTTLLHCISNYPAKEINSNLGFLDTLKTKFKNFSIGYSSHENSIINSILCLSKQVDFIERHITLNKSNNGLDHSSSSDYQELEIFKTYNENFKKIFRDKKKLPPNQGEIINIQNLGRSYYASKNFKKGEKIKKFFLIKRHPCLGLTDINLDGYLNKKLIKDLKINQPLTKSYFEKNDLNQSIINKLDRFNFSLPIRPRDYKKIYNIIPVKNFELHLSFSDVNNFKINHFEKSFVQKSNFSIHMPDYCDENSLIDFFSQEKKIKQKSLDLLLKTIKIANQISNLNKKKVVIIVSLSGINQQYNKIDYYKKIKVFVDKIRRKHSINLLPQWLPVDAWYFGGNARTKVFSDPRDLDFLNKINLNLCLDTSHYILSCNYYKLNILKYFSENIKIFKHFHLSDAKGTDGEGVLIGSGEIIKSGLLKRLLLDKQTVKVLETWQGHLNDLFNMKKDIKKITKNFI